MIYDLSKNIDVLKAKAKFEKLVSDQKPIELKPIRQKRSIKQNAFLHVCISLFAIDTGYTAQEAKTVLKREKGLYYEKNGEKFIKATREMDSKELTEFIDWIRHFASLQGIYIPTPEEYLLNQIAIDKSIKQNEMYL